MAAANAIISGPVLRPIAVMSLTNLPAMAILLCRNLLDAFYASRVSVGSLEAFTLVIPITLLLVGLSQGISIAAGTVLSTRLGTGVQITRQFILHALIAALLGGALLSAILLALLPAGFSLYHVNVEVLDNAREMATWQIAAMPVLFLYGVLTALLRAMGDTYACARAATAGLLTGVTTTPLLVFIVLKYSTNPVLGISIGLQVGYACTAIIVLVRLRSRGLLGGGPDKSALANDLRSFAKIGTPVILTNLTTLAAVFVITGVIAGSGADAVAAFGVVSRLDQFALTIVNAIILSLLPFVSQNAAAANWWRVRRGVVSAVELMAGCWLVVGLGMALGAPWIIALFNLPVDSRELAIQWLRLTAFAFLFEGLIVTAIDLYQVVHRPRTALIGNLIYLYALQLPALLWAAARHDTAALYLAITGAQVAAGVALLIFGAVRGRRIPESTSFKGQANAKRI